MAAIQEIKVPIQITAIGPLVEIIGRFAKKLASEECEPEDPLELWAALSEKLTTTMNDFAFRETDMVSGADILCSKELIDAIKKQAKVIEVRGYCDLEIALGSNVKIMGNYFFVHQIAVKKNIRPTEWEITLSVTLEGPRDGNTQPAERPGSMGQSGECDTPIYTE
jgi:hypothetical protein